MTQSFKSTLLWIVTSLLAFATALNFLPAALVDNQYIPVGNDSFYHARRILDAIANPHGFYEFDRFIHYPEGSWITWPWGYDYLIALIVRAYLWLFGPQDPMTVIAYIPVAASAITLALVIAITGALSLSMPIRTLICLAFAISPLTQALHGVGIIDHHFAEHIFILITTLFAMLWMRKPESVWPPLILGIALGLSVAFHNGLFVLQLPVLVSLFVSWIRGQQPRQSSSAIFAIGLLGATAAVSLPSQPIHNGSFEFYLLSWFHVYVAACSALAALLITKLTYSPRRLLILIVLAALLLTPLVAQLILGSEFIAATVDAMKGIDEVQSPVIMALNSNGATRLSHLYGLFIWVAPLILGFGAWQIFREKRPDFRMFWVFATFGSILLLFQLRLHYFGSLALYLAPFYIISQFKSTKPWIRFLIIMLGCVVFGLAITPSIKLHLLSRAAAGLDSDYSITRAIYPILGKACKSNPGLVLANADQGHYVRYHTDCYVLANNFRLTSQHAEKIRELKHLYTLTPLELLQQAPKVKYVIASLTGPYQLRPDGGWQIMSIAQLREVNTPLNGKLLLDSAESLPSRFKQLMEIRYANLPYPIARLYEIEPETEATKPST